MCGIGGVYGLHISKAEREVFENLLLINSFRGRDSTGLMKVSGRKGYHIQILKSLLPSYRFFDTDEAEELIWKNQNNPHDETIWGKDPIAFIAHCRAATKGVINIKNQHPFDFDRVVGVHNGTIRGTFPHSSEYETDSEALYRNINDYGIEDALNNISDIDSAYALVWIDKEEKTINFIRNSRRPLNFTFLFGRQALVWSSASEHLKSVVDSSSSNPQGWDPSKKEEEYFYLKPNQLMTIKLGAAPTTATIKTLDIKESFTVGVTATVGSTGNKHNTYRNTGMVRGPDGVLRSPKSHEKYLQKKANKAAKYNNHKKDGQDLAGLSWLQAQLPPAKETSTEPQSTAELGFKLSCGCVSCGEKVLLEDVQKNKRQVYWWSRDHYSCDNCYENSPGDWVRVAFNQEEKKRVH